MSVFSVSRLTNHFLEIITSSLRAQLFNFCSENLKDQHFIWIQSNHHYLVSSYKVPKSSSSGVATIKHLPPFPSSAASLHSLFALPAGVPQASSSHSIVWLMSLEAIRRESKPTALLMLLFCSDHSGSTLQCVLPQTLPPLCQTTQQQHSHTCFQHHSFMHNSLRFHINFFLSNVETTSGTGKRKWAFPDLPDM